MILDFGLSILDLIEGSGSFYLHARAGGHPGISARHFWIPAFAGMAIFK